MQRDLSKKTLEFLQKLKEGPQNELENLVGDLKVKNMTEIFETIGAQLKIYSEA